MNVASLELCRELYELSGWDDTHSFWHSNKRYANGKMVPKYYLSFVEMYLDVDYMSMPDYEFDIPAYDLGYLLRKLPNSIEHDYPNDLEISKDNDEKYWASYCHVDEDIMTKCADTPEDAACKLLCELIKQGVLTTKRSSDE